MRFSILIPTWNNLDYLKLCVESIRENSAFDHQILVHVNDGSDGTLEWVSRQSDIEYTHSPENTGVCWPLNGLRPLVECDYIAFSNDDMYLLPGWDVELSREIERISHKMFFLSSTLLQPRPFFCPSVIAPADYGESVESFEKERLLRDYMTHEHADWSGSTWPLNVVHRDTWDLVGGYSVEYSPGLYSDPDFSAKLYMAGVRIFKGLSASRVYHFEARSTGRVKKNKGSRQFLAKWGITSKTFTRAILRRGEPYTQEPMPPLSDKLRVSLLRCKLKNILSACKKNGAARTLWE
ncbi:MAG: glycosyltransferase [Rikenellaceae bacterium]